ncbi:MAG: DUF3298 domain-containing protein [Candidatus Merdivicinus sp.]|jgi:hypothetical protein
MDKKQYEQIPIPEHLPQAVEEAIETAKEKRRSSSSPRVWISRSVGMAAAVAACFFVLVNANPVFAETMRDIPVIGALCRVFTMEEYQISDNKKLIDVRMPNLDSTGKPELEARVNLEISRIIHEEIQHAEQRAEEYFEAFVATGGDPDEFHPIAITVDYEVKSITERYASFVIWKYEALASSYTEYYFYNIDLETGKILTLRDLLGPDYQQIGAEAVEEGKQNLSEDQKQMLFEDVDPADYIDDGTDFYINSDGKIVLVFEKYELAAGAAGALEFPISEVSFES